MRRILLTLAMLSAAAGVSAQSVADSTSTGKDYNKWSIEAGGGFNKPFRTMSPMYNMDALNPFTVDLGVRFMFNPQFGLKLDAGYNKLQDGGADISLPFESTYIRANLQGVINMGRVLKFEDWTNTFGLLAHGGPGYYSLKADETGASDKNDQGLNFMGGLTGQIKLGKRVVFNIDGTMIANTLQEISYDGFGPANGDVFKGFMINVTGGLTFYLGSNETHADWYYEEDKLQEQFDNLDKRVGDLETMLSDADKDGVPDYLDTEPNTTTGVAVDSKGRAVDTNSNGVPDELESYLAKTYGDPAKSGTSGDSGADSGYVPNNELVRNLINEGYVTTYFDFNKTKPTNVSSKGIDFILTYLRNNPSASVEIIGHADEIGRTPYNDKLSSARAQAVKNVLVKAKIDPSRLKIVPLGEDTSVENDVAARKLVRRVTFRVN